MTVTATELKSRLGEHLERARHGPVLVSKSGRDYVAIISAEELERLQALDDAYWAARARRGAASGYLTPEETMAFIEARLKEIEEGE